jgi:hypothetical protein
MVRIAHLFSFVFCVFLFCLSSSCVLCTQCCQSLDCSFVIAPSVFSNVYYCLWIDPTGTRTHDLPHSRKHANHHTTDVVRLIFNNHFDNPLTILQKIKFSRDHNYKLGFNALCKMHTAACISIIVGSIYIIII